MTTKRAPAEDKPTETRLQEGLVRMTIEVPASVHARLKAACFSEGVTMKDAIHDLIVEKYGES